MAADKQAHNAQNEGKSIFCGVGERTREGEELYRDIQEAGVLDNTEGLRAHRRIGVANRSQSLR